MILIMAIAKDAKKYSSVRKYIEMRFSNEIQKNKCHKSALWAPFNEIDCIKQILFEMWYTWDTVEDEKNKINRRSMIWWKHCLNAMFTKLIETHEMVFPHLILKRSYLHPNPMACSQQIHNCSIHNFPFQIFVVTNANHNKFTSLPNLLKIYA